MATTEPRRIPYVPAEPLSTLRSNGGRGIADSPASVRHTHDVPLSFPQQRLWFLDQLAPSNPFYIETSAHRIRTTVNVRALELSVNAIVARHEVLRTVFIASAGEPMQRVLDSVHVPLSVIDLADVSPDRCADQLSRVVTELAVRPFDLTTAPLFRTCLVRLTNDDHVLVIASHHIITDGWSSQVFGRELSTLYGCLLSGEPVDLPELSIQYADYARWQRSPERAATVNSQLDFWRRQLADLTTIDLPTDRPRPRTVSYRGGQVPVVIPARLADDIASLAREERATTFMVCLAAWAMLLSRYSGQRDIAIGVPIAGRDRPEFEHLIGCLLNNLVIRLDLSGDPTFRHVIERTRTVVVDAFAHQDVPFERLVEELQPTRDASRHPMFQIMFQHFDMNQRGESGPHADHVEVTRTTSIVDLFMHVWDDRGGLRGKLEYSSDLFDAETARDIARRFVLLLRGAVQQPDAPISQHPLLTTADASALRGLAQGPVAPLGGMSVLDLWRRRVTETPTAVALIENGRTYTYSDTQQRVDHIAGTLVEAGCRAGDRVAICLDRSVDAVASMLAIMTIRCAWVPLDPGAPPEVLGHVVKDCGAVAVLTLDVHRHQIIDDNLHVIVLDAPDRSASSSNHVQSTPTADDVACVIYTSGSTGRPKGVITTHRSIVNRLTWMWATYPFGAGETLALKTALGFVDSIWETLGPLLGGVPAVIVDDDTARNPDALIDLLAEHRVSRLLTVPSLLRALLDSGREIGIDLPHLTLWCSSGEALTTELVDRFHSFVPDGTLVNLYGSSEVVGDVTCGRVVPGGGPVDIGTPIANTTIHILDDNLSPVPAGVCGRLFVEGASVTRGYHDQPALTAERFVPNPLAATPGERMYDTGDGGRWLRNGRIELLGRTDHQVKIRGHRIELGHVEQVLLEHPDVDGAAVVVIERNGHDRHLVAHVQTELGATELRVHARAHLSAHMVPSVFMPVSELPLKPNGKVDRTALERSSLGIEADRVVVPPATDAEHVVKEMWDELLPVAARDATTTSSISVDIRFWRPAWCPSSANAWVSSLRSPSCSSGPRCARWQRCSRTSSSPTSSH